MTEATQGDVFAFLHLMSRMETSLPTLADIVAACDVREVDGGDAARLLAEAIDLGLVDAAEDFGSRTQFVISTLGAEKLGISLTFDSRRWVGPDGQLLGPHDRNGRYRDPVPAAEEDDHQGPLHLMADPRQRRPDEILAAAERTPEKPYSGDAPELAPCIRRFYGLNAIWAGEELISGTCPYCLSDRMAIDAYCVKCHRAGADRFLKKPPRSTRRQMPRHQSKLKGGV